MIGLAVWISLVFAGVPEPTETRLVPLPVPVANRVTSAVQTAGGHVLGRILPDAAPFPPRPAAVRWNPLPSLPAMPLRGQGNAAHTLPPIADGNTDTPPPPAAEAGADASPSDASPSDPATQRIRVLLRLANRYFLEEDAVKAVESYREAMALGAVLDRETTREYATALQRSGNLPEARAVIETWLRNHPEDTGIRADAVAYALTAEDHLAALAHQRVLLEAAPDDADIRFHLAQIEYWAGDPQAGRLTLAPLREAHPDHGAYLALDAELAFAAEDFKDAGALYDALLEDAPDDADLRSRAAQAQFLAGQPAQAVAHYAWMEARGDMPDDRLQEFAVVLSTLERHEEAARRYAELVRRHPESEAHRLALAQAWLWAEAHENADAAVADLLRIAPDNDAYLDLQADIAFAAQAFRTAAKRYEARVKAHPEHPGYRLRAARSHLYANQPDAAMPHFDWLREHGHAVAEFTVEQARAANVLGEYRQALRLLEPLLAADPGRLDLWQDVLDAQLGLERFDEAVDVSDLLFEASAQTPDDRLQHAERCLWAKQYDAAQTVLAPLVDTDKPDPRALRMYADALLWSDAAAEAYPYYARLLVLEPEDVALRRTVAETAMAAQAHAEALAAYEHLLRLTPDDATLHTESIRALYLTGQKDAAFSRVADALDRHPRHAPLARLGADMALERHDYPHAIEWYRRALEFGDTEHETRLRLARVLSWNQNYREAQTEYDALIATHPDDVSLQREQARVYGWARQYRKALDAYDRILAARDGPEPVRLERIAKHAFYRGHDRKAIRAYDDLIEKEPDNLEAHFDLGQVYSRQSMWKKARRQYEAVLQIEPGHLRAPQALDKVNRHALGFDLESGYRYDRRESTGQMTDMRTQTVPMSLHTWIREAWCLTYHHELEHYAFESGWSVPAQQIRGQIQTPPNALWDVQAGGGIRQLGRGVRDEWLYNLRGRLRLAGLAFLDVSSRRVAFYENEATLRNGLYQLRHDARATLRANDNLSATGWAQVGNLSDNNLRLESGAEGQWKVIPEPYRLTLTWRSTWYGYTATREAYFTPSYFYEHWIFADWRHYLSREELFWGSRRTYYEVGYGTGFDKNREWGHVIRGGAYSDVRPWLSVGAQVHFRLGKVYREQRVEGTVRLLF